ncbi:MAG: helix-turn-helix transcriptional regulator [Anaerolineales bacterium]|nr:helix-turn-helix transcriptional regulator [Anaerolineales bacterium]
MFLNMKNSSAEKRIAAVLKILGSPFRIKILYAIGYGEACVCHLETLLNKRQAYISQHLMVLRDAGILESRRDGKYIFYRVADHRIFELIDSAAAILHISSGQKPELSETSTRADCNCPRCNPETDSCCN